ncbi:MAG: Rap1a/Tai family immunity protein [Steroidobacter sp.]
MHYLSPPIALFALATAATASELAPLSGPQLQEHCGAYADEPESASGLLCAVYVGGFIEGAAAIAPRALLSEEERTESFTDRALRTRLGVPRPREPLYCMSSAVSLQQIIAQVVTYAEQNPPGQDMSASEVVAATLQKFYSCAA